jgi:hypothetical protein
MPYKDRDKQKQAQKESRDRRKAVLDAIKSVPCMDCGGSFPPICMDFDHRDPAEKKFTIGQHSAIVNLNDLMTEIDKCDIVCANCHRIRHLELST